MNTATLNRIERKRYYLHGDLEEGTGTRRQAAAYYCACCDLFLPIEHFAAPPCGSGGARTQAERYRLHAYSDLVLEREARRSGRDRGWRRPANAQNCIVGPGPLAELVAVGT